MTAASTLGRQPITIVEMDLRQVINGTATIVTYRLCSHDVVPPVSLDARPVIERVQSLPTKLDIGESLGMRAAISITCRDFINDGDVAGGPADSSATFFRLLKARVPYHANRPVRVITGYLVDGQVTNARTLHYLLTRIDGPNRTGTVTLHCTDALIQADNRRAQAPRVGTASLLTGLNTTDTTATIGPTESIDDYPVSGFGRFGDADELVAFSRSGSVITLQRGVRGTVAVSHLAGDAFQTVLTFDDATLAEVTRTLLVDYAGLDPALIDLAAWTLEDDLWLGAFRLTATIWDPTGVADLLQELTQQFPFFIVYDARVPRLDFQAIKPATFGLVASLNERQHLLANSISVTDDLEKRISQIWFYFGQKDPSAASDDPRNYSRLVPFIDRQAEADHGDARIRKVYSRWLPADQQAVVASIGERLLLRLRDGRRTIGFHLDAKDGDAWVGDTIEITTSHLVNTDGTPVTTQAQVIEARDIDVGTSASYQAEDLRTGSRNAVYAPDTTPDYDQATAVERSRYGFYADDLDEVSGDPAYRYL